MLMGEACYGRVPGPVMVEREKNGKGYDFPVGYVKCGVSRKAPHYVEGTESRTLMFIKDLPKALKPRRVRMRR
jgi:hypothetical protein